MTSEEAEKRREKWRSDKRISRQRQKEIQQDPAISQNTEPIPHFSSDQISISEKNSKSDSFIKKIRNRCRVLEYRCKQYADTILKWKERSTLTRRNILGSKNKKIYK